MSIEWTLRRFKLANFVPNHSCLKIEAQLNFVSCLNFAQFEPQLFVETKIFLRLFQILLPRKIFFWWFLEIFTLHKNVKCPFNGHFVFLDVLFLSLKTKFFEFVSGQICELTNGAAKLLKYAAGSKKQEKKFPTISKNFYVA